MRITHARRIRRSVWIGLLALTLQSCGGGGSSGASAPIAAPLVATATLQPTVKQLTPAEVTQVQESTTTSIELSPSIKATTGQVLLVDGAAIKLGAQETPVKDSANLRFAKLKPALTEIYSSLVLDGEFATDDTTLPSALEKIQTKAVSGSASCAGSSSLPTSFSGVKCTFKFTDDFAFTFKGQPRTGKANLLSGDWSVGVNGVFKSWDAIRNTGSGELTFAVSGNVSLGISVAKGLGTLDPLNSANHCSDSLAAGDLVAAKQTGRLRLTTLFAPIPGTNVAGLAGLAFPICISAGVESEFAGELLSLGGGTTFKIAVGNGAPPTLTTVPTTIPASVPVDAVQWTMAPTSNAVVRPSFKAKLEVNFETSMEMLVYKTFYVGFQEALSGTIEASVEASAARFGSTTAIFNLKAAPDFCMSAPGKLTFTATAYTEVPALSFFTSGKAQAAQKFYDATLSSYESWKVGKCARVTSQTMITASVDTTNVGETFKVTAKIADAAPGSSGFATDQFASGTVKIKDKDSGDLLCTATLDQTIGTGTCDATGPIPGNRNLVGEYSGDDNFAPSHSSTLLHTVQASAIVNKAWRGRIAITGDSSESFDTTGGGAILEPTCCSFGLPFGAALEFFFVDGVPGVYLMESGNNYDRRWDPSLTWSVYSGGMSFSIPIYFAHYGVNFVGTRTTTLTVTSQSATQISGKYEISTTVGYFVAQPYGPATWRTAPQRITGSWIGSAIDPTIVRSVPMNGYDICSNSGYGKYFQDFDNGVSIFTIAATRGRCG